MIRRARFGRGRALAVRLMRSFALEVPSEVLKAGGMDGGSLISSIRILPPTVSPDLSMGAVK